MGSFGGENMAVELEFDSSRSKLSVKSNQHLKSIALDYKSSEQMYRMGVELAFDPSQSKLVRYTKPELTGALTCDLKTNSEDFVNGQTILEFDSSTSRLVLPKKENIVAKVENEMRNPTQNKLFGFDKGKGRLTVEEKAHQKRDHRKDKEELKLMSVQSCSEDALESVRRSQFEGFPDKQSMTVAQYIFSSIQGVLLVLGLVINFLICFVMVRRGKVKKNLSNFFLFNLSLVEIILWLVLLPLSAFVSMAQVQTSIPCKIIVFSMCTCVAMIFGLLAAIAFDRYTNIVTPLKGITLEERKPMVLGVVLVAAIASSAPFLYSVEMRVLSMDFKTHSFFEGRINSTPTVTPVTLKLKWTTVNTPVIRHAQGEHHSTTNVTGNATHPRSGRMNSTFNNNTTCILPLRICDVPADLKGQVSCTIFFILSFVFPLVLIAVTYSKVVHRLWLRSRSSDAKGTAASKAKLRAVRMLILVVLTYLVTDGPWISAYLLYSFHPREAILLQDHFIVLSIVTTLFFASAVLTPTVHAFHSSTVQREIVRILCCRFRKAAPLPTSTSSRVPKQYRSIHFAKQNGSSSRDTTSSARLVTEAEGEE